MDRKRVSREEAELICTDLIFTNFICPAIINPEPHGIIADTPISYVARFNLMQIGQVIQTLALWPYEDPPAYMNGLLHMFSDNPMPGVVTNVLKFNDLSLEAMFPANMADDEGKELYARRTFMGTAGEVQLLVSQFLFFNHYLPSWTTCAAPAWTRWRTRRCARS